MAYRNRQSRVLIIGICAVTIALFASAPCDAQSFTGSITGTVTDPSGALVPSAAVTVIQTETNRRVALVTHDGSYLATALPVGDYRVEVAAPGFKLGVRTGIMLELNQAAVINFALDVGIPTERVEVVGAGDQLDRVGDQLARDERGAHP